jgi:hypothetical protein
MQASVNLVEALWILHPVIEIPLAGILYGRKLHRQFPIFFAYILFQAVQFAISFPIYRWGSSTNYFYAYWISAIICWIFGFKIIHEVYSDVCRPFHALNDMVTVMMKWTGLVLLLLAIVFGAFTDAPLHTPLLETMIVLEHCVRLTQCALILLLVLVSSHLGVSWRRQSIGIALGFGWFAGVELIAFGLYFGGQVPDPALDLLDIAAYSLALIVWIGYAAISVSNDLPNFQTGRRSIVPGAS